MKKKRLEKDLKISGASRKEQAELTAIAEQLEVFKNMHLSKNTRERIARIPNQDKVAKRPSLRLALSSLTMATAVFVFIFLGYSQFAQQSSPDSPSAPTEQVREDERKEIETILEESESQLRELQQVEEAPPEAVEEARKKYEQALDRWRNWEAGNSNKDSGERQNRRRRSNNDVRGSWTNGEQNEDQQYQNRFWRR